VIRSQPFSLWLARALIVLGASSSTDTSSEGILRVFLRSAPVSSSAETCASRRRRRTPRIGIRARHSSPCLTKSCIANCESPTNAWPVLFSKRTCRPRALAMLACIASTPGFGTQVGTTLGTLFKKRPKGLLG